MGKVIFVIKDGWGYRKDNSFNAVLEAKTPYSDFYEKNFPTAVIKASGEAVGLPNNYQGNSEVGHITIGAGRIVKEDLTVINEAIKNKSFFRNKALLEAIEKAKKKDKSVHLIGLLQKEGVHSHSNHLYSLLELCKKNNLGKVFLHVITDGRDAPVNNAEKEIKKLIGKTKQLKIGEVVSISGRYYAMDRDKRWERTKKAYKAITEGVAEEYFLNPLDQIKSSYRKKETDEFIVPKVKKGYSGFKDGDSVIFFNFRSDRPRQLTMAITEKEFNEWKRRRVNVFFVGMTAYYKSLRNVAFKNRSRKNILGEVISKKGLNQLRISETEKYAHVTYFFNNQKEEPFLNEERIMIPSLKIPTYDLKPEMKAKVVADKIISEIKKERYEFIVVNLVNADMVGHTAIKKAIVKAVEVVDLETHRIVQEGLQHDYTIFIFADHGNAEDQRPRWATSHTTNPVKLTVVSTELKKIKKKGELQDIAPTALSEMGIKKPKEMSGESLIL
jgi:2,3-bisphosphoglycerate-independent phosphoglycerate mutase